MRHKLNVFVQFNGWLYNKFLQITDFLLLTVVARHLMYRIIKLTLHAQELYCHHHQEYDAEQIVYRHQHNRAFRESCLLYSSLHVFFEGIEL